MAELSLTVKLHYANDDAPSMKSFSLENVRHDASALDLLVTQSATVARRERVGELRWRWGPKMEAMVYLYVLKTSTPSNKEAFS